MLPLSRPCYPFHATLDLRVERSAFAAHLALISSFPKATATPSSCFLCSNEQRFNVGLPILNLPLACVQLRSNHPQSGRFAVTKSLGRIYDDDAVNAKSELAMSTTPNPQRADSLGLSLSLSKTIGSTTTSSSGLSHNEDCFVTISGSTAVVQYIDETLNVKQKFFRARPGQGTSSSQEPLLNLQTPEPKNRNLTSVRASIFGASLTSTASDQTAASTKISARQRTRTASCVALSPDGRFIAVGEVGMIKSCR